MLEPLPFPEYVLPLKGDLTGMIVSPELINVVLVNENERNTSASATLVGWTRENVQVYLRQDSRLAFAASPWLPDEGSVSR